MKAELIKENNGYTLFVGGKIIGDTNGHPLKSITNKLSLKNCQAIERGYDLDELVNEEFSKFDQEVRIVCRRQLRESLANMFSKAVELMGDKKYSEEDLKRVFIEGSNWTKDESLKHDTTFGQAMSKSIQSLQQTEWDVEIEMDAIPADRAPGGWDRFPKLDADGCLILKPLPKE
jgi:hypothetical protein